MTLRLDRERIPWLAEGGRETISRMHQLREKSDRDVVLEIDFLPTLSVLYEALYHFRNDEKVFVISDAVRKKVENMDISSLTQKYNGLDLVLQGTDCECGTIAMSLSSMVSASYLILDPKTLLMIVYREHQPIGYVSYDGSDEAPTCEIVPYSLYSMMNYNSFPKSKEEARRQEPVMEAFKYDLHGEESVPDTWLTRRKAKSKSVKSAPYIQEYFDKYDLTEFMLKVLIFMRTSQVYTKQFVPDPTPSVRRKKNYRPLNYISVDAAWDMNIDVNTPFPVRGHFVHQPFKIDGEWGRKLIYVETYMKKGYHRKATKVRSNYGK